jgi:uncharacterized protein
MNCPVCSTELKIAERLGIEIDHCPKCRGIWLDRGELDKILERSQGEGATYTTPPPVRDAAPPPRDAYPQREQYRDDDYRQQRKPDWDDDDDRRRYGDQPYKKKRSFIEDIFDF